MRVTYYPLQHFIAGKVLSEEESKKVTESLSSTTQRVIVVSAQGRVARAWLSAISSVKSLAVPSDLMRVAVKLFLDVLLKAKSTKSAQPARNHLRTSTLTLSLVQASKG